MIPLYLNPRNQNQILKIPYSKDHKKYFSFHEYLGKKKPLKFKTESVEAFCKRKVSARQPDGFIFHAGRTGSTLLVKMLNSLNSVEVFSEIDILTDFLLQQHGSDKKLETVVKQIIQSYISEVPETKKIIFKFTSIDTLSIEFILKLYPDVPCVYVFNSPEKILSSQLFRPPRWARNLRRIMPKTGRPISSKLKSSPLAMQSVILESSFKRVLSVRKYKDLKIIDYSLILTPKIFDIFKWFGISTNRKQKTEANLLRRFDSKRVGKVFTKSTQKYRTPVIAAKYIYDHKKLEAGYLRLLKLM